jgi:hypothetical protein
MIDARYENAQQAVFLNSLLVSFNRFDNSTRASSVSENK